MEEITIKLDGRNVEVIAIEYNRLRDFLYKIVDPEKSLIEIAFYKNKFYRTWIFDGRILMLISSTETLDGDIIEFDIATGKFEVVDKVQRTPTKVNFVVTKPIRLEFHMKERVNL